MSIISAKKLTKIYGDSRENSTIAIDGVSIDIEQGEFTAVMGPSGSGKSTLLGMLCGILAPTNGEIIIDGESIGTMNKARLSAFRRQKLGFVFQEFNLLDNLTVRENIVLPMVLDKKSPEEMNNRAEKLMKQFGIYECKDKYPYEISGGQMQRTAVSRALVNNPIVIFADEPTGNLDSKSSASVMDCFTTINSKMDTTILMVTHDVFAASFCKNIIFIKDGQINMKITRKGSRQEFFEQILDCQVIVGGDQKERLL